MSQDQEIFALDWIKSDLLETLDNAKVALEAYSESEQDETRMRTCLTSLHQVHGTLVMLELPGVALLADHLERLAQALLNQSIAQTDGAVEDVMQGILELPGYIEAIQSGEPDSERPVIPLVNRIRQHLDMELLAEPAANVLAGSATESAMARFERIDGHTKARKVRSAYQQVLLSILKGDDRAQAVMTLNKVAQGLCRICDETPHEGQWQAFGEFVKSLEGQSGPLDAEAIKLLRRVDAEIRLLATQGGQALQNPVNRELIEQLLGQAEQREHSSPVLADLKGAIAEGTPVDSLVISGRQALASAALALRDEVSELKDRLDLEVRSENTSKGSFTSLITPLTQIGSTLSLLGFQSSHATVFDQIEALNECVLKQEYEQETLVGVADALVKVDENLASATQGMRGKGEVERITTDAHRAVAVETQAELEQVKNAIVGYVSSGWDYDNLADIPAVIDHICGALDMIPLARPARQLGECRRYIADVLPHRSPDWQSLDHLADAISGVDYYLERVVEDSNSGTDRILELVDRSLGALDFTVGEPAEAEAEDAAITVEPSEGQAKLIQNDTEEQPDKPAPFVVGADQLPDDEEAAFAAQGLNQDPDDGFDLGGEDFSISAEEVEQVPADDTQFVEESVKEPVEEQSFAHTAAVTAIAAAAGSSVVAGLADAYQDDAEIAEIFLEEAAEVVDQIDHWIPEWRKDLGHEEALTELRRSFHTLKGSGRMVGANVVGELSWSVENMLNRVMDNTVEPTEQFVDVAQQSRNLVPSLMQSFEEQQAPDLQSVGQLIEAADLLSSGGTLEEVAPVETVAAELTGAPETTEPPVAETAAAETVDALPAAEQASEFEDDETLLIFADEAREHLDVLRASIADDQFDASEDAVRALHTLAGSAGIAQIEALHTLARPAYEVGRAARTQQNMDSGLSKRVAVFMQDYVETTSEYVEALSHGTDSSIPAELTATAETLLDQIGTENPAQELLSIEGLGTLFEAVEYLDQWHEGTQDLGFAENLAATLRRLDEQAQTLEHAQLAEFAEVLGAVHQQHEDLPLDAGTAQVLRKSHEELLLYLDALVADQTPVSITESHQQLTALLEEVEQVEPESQAEAEAEAEVEIEAEAEAELESTDAAEPMATEAPQSEESQDEPDSEKDDAFDLDALGIAGGLVGSVAATAPEDRAANAPIPASASPTRALDNTTAAGASDADKDFDIEIIEIFVEEAEELLESLDGSTHELEQARDNQVHVEHMLRDLHTLKGGARLAALTALGDLTHEFESEVLEHQSSADSASDDFVALLYRRHEQLLAMVADVKARMEAGGVGMAQALAVTGSAEASADTSANAPESTVDEVSTEPEQAATESASEAEADNVVPLAAAQAASKPAAVAPPQASERPAVERSPQEMVRVGAGLLEELVNLAGESSIMRARVEQGLGDFTVALDEMETTIGRVREQLRRLEIETEAQILFRQERFEAPSHEGFDPLEMDRYSQLQQLSRSLSESASDMLDLKETLLFKARESETLLLQQARINTELQEGLMRTRMVPFNRLLPRLRRTVRQVAGELNKDVEFSAFNAEGELDRNLLERMIPPLEHMLRNAVDHGIESPAERRTFSKPEAGQIELRLSREGGDVLIEIGDDGAGIDVETVRAKAIERGLMSPDAKLRDDEVLQFVLAPGFSTAKSVTQISGRGVGMDVVHSEVKQLGGSINISSQPGQGTRFSLRVPFTVSVNRALMVSVGDDLYAIPLNTIEGIVLLGPQELEKLYAPGANPFEYAGMSYHVRYLGHFLGREYRGNVSQSSAPVVLVRSGDQSIAVHVDSVQGSREIVVKSLGPQFAGVGGISGATILGDGSVVVILDLLALIRTRGEAPSLPNRRQSKMDSRTRCVMVVDDSVTVRKVTSRLLERQGMDVLVAKDGVEAVALLQERRPDILLLDIEMPRMDGFEVARHVRHDDHLDGLPIVMISSRTGEKHQQRATGLGVNRFLGKPFQESELLETIDQLVKS